MRGADRHHVPDMDELPGVVRIRDLFGFPESSQRQGVGRRTAGRKIVLGIGNAIGADVCDDLREAVRVANELSIKIRADQRDVRSEEHTSELQSLMRISYAVFCLKKKTIKSYHK